MTKFKKPTLTERLKFKTEYCKLLQYNVQNSHRLLTSSIRALEIIRILKARDCGLFYDYLCEVESLLDTGVNESLYGPAKKDPPTHQD